MRWSDKVKSFGRAFCDRVLRNNQLNGTLNIGTEDDSQLKLIDLQNNLITDVGGGEFNGTLM
jgi:hypothetical protein